jgi:hypothetical protein
LHLFEEKVRGDLDLSFHQLIFLLSEGNLLDPDLGVLSRFHLFFVSYLSIALVALWDLGEKDLSTSCDLAITFGASI